MIQSRKSSFKRSISYPHTIPKESIPLVFHALYQITPQPLATLSHPIFHNLLPPRCPLPTLPVDTIPDSPTSNDPYKGLITLTHKLSPSTKNLQIHFPNNALLNRPKSLTHTPPRFWFAYIFPIHPTRPPLSHATHTQEF